MHLFFAGRNARRITLIANHLPLSKSSATPAAVVVEPVSIMAFATFPEDRGDREIAAEAARLFSWFAAGSPSVIRCRR